MEFILIIGGCLLCLVIGSLISNKDNQSNSTTYTPNAKQEVKKQNDQTFRPTTRSRTTPNISFTNQSSSDCDGRIPAIIDFEGLHDAFTGAPIDKALGLYQCQSCKVYYHTESHQVLREVNNSQCVSCQSTNIIAVVADAKTTTGKDYTPNVVTLQNYKEYDGSVVTFEGRVHKVNESRRGNDFAVMFENQSWVRGFKLVFFRGTVRKVGGKRFINSLKGKNIRVRGLIINHPKFGYEIIVSEKSMIQSIK